MSNLYDQIVSQRGTLEDLASKIPGFKGYMEMSARREADRMIREHLANQFKPVLDGFAMLETNMVNSGGLLYMDRTKSIRTKIYNLQTRIAVDTPGYSGFFAANKIGPDELEKVYAFDEAMGRFVDEIKGKMSNLETAVAAGGEGIPAALNELEMKVMEAHQAYDLREDVLKKIGE